MVNGILSTWLNSNSVSVTGNLKKAYFKQYNGENNKRYIQVIAYDSDDRKRVITLDSYTVE